MNISLENFDERGRIKPIINSPRSIQACKRQGIQPQQIIIKDLNDIKKIYNDGMNDKKSLEIKLAHFEKRRKQKVNLLKAERNKLIEEGFNHIYRGYSNAGGSRNTVEIREIQNKLEKKKLMDEVRNQIKRKQLEIKQLAIQQKKANVEKQKLEKQLEKEQQRKEKQYRKNCNLLKNDVVRQAKISNFLETEQQRIAKIQQTRLEKQIEIQNERRLKEEFYQSKLRQIQQQKMQVKLQKQRKLYLKMQQQEQKASQKQASELESIKNMQEEKRQYLIEKESRKREKDIQEKKNNMQVFEVLKVKQLQKEEYLQVIQDKKKRFYQKKKEQHEQKQRIVRQKLQQQKLEEQKRRRILEVKDQIIRDQLEKRRLEKIREDNDKKQEFIKREEQRKIRLEDEQLQRRRNTAFTFERQRIKQQEAQKKKKQLDNEQKEKYIDKVLREKQIRENKQRMERIQSYEKLKKVEAYEEKVKVISKQKANRKVQTMVRSISRKDIEQKLMQENYKIKNRSSVQNDTFVEKANISRNPQKKKSQKQSRQETKNEIRQEQIEKMIENLKIQLLKQEHELMVEEDEVQKTRLARQKQAQTVTELKRLRKIHQFQRQKFRDNLNDLIKLNEERINKYKEQLTT